MRIVLTSGAEFEGIYNQGPDPTTCRLAMVQQKKLPNAAEITNGAGRREQATMSFQRKEITEARVVAGGSGKAEGKNLNGRQAVAVSWLVADLDFSGNRSTFRTDTAISNSRFGNERELQRWVPDSTDGTDGGLEATAPSGAAWDQFEANRRLFGLSTDYDENIYTTTIDRGNPHYKDRVAAADRKAREIERSTPTTAHVAEERIMDFAGGGDQGDEEDK